MSETRGDLSLPEQDAGVLFRAEMWLTNFFLGYWKHVVTAIVVVLLAILVVGQYQSSWRRNQRAMTAQTAEEWSNLPQQAIPGQLTDEQSAKMRGVADTLVTLGAGFKGPAAAEAYLKSAELYRLLGEREEQKASLEKAVPYAEGALYYAARSALANLALEDGDSATAISIYRELMDEMEGYLGQEAAINLAQTYEHLDQDAEARSVYLEFQGKWPESPLMDEVQDRMDRLGAVAEPEPEPMEDLQDEPVDEPVDESLDEPVDEPADEPVDEPGDETSPE